MIQVNLREAEAQLSALIERALEGEEVIIARAGEPVVRLVPAAAAAPREWGQDRGLVWMADDFEELPPELAEAFADLKIFPDEP